MQLTTIHATFPLDLVKFTPNRLPKFLYIQQSRKSTSLHLITNIPELANISTCQGIYVSEGLIHFLFPDTCESLPLARTTNLNRLLREGFTDSQGVYCNALRHVHFSKPLLDLTESHTGYNLTYSEPLIPTPAALNLIQIGA